ncbi:group III truncated hemoglobin [Xanthovirga aplysinae]|uniref:group III truncated hemoglobin n=1 Tax=Xanthovirga aplysinae TaxID=2529853 RepID=UPI0012BC2F41|nr:group III truncated hemoglobin [Xanthovirga aplysinae]MTI31876.1 group III truncated hemoglobin [Xanthovirga aplysinae]
MLLFNENKTQKGLKDLSSREDVFLLVSSFYAKVRKSPEIGDFFNQTITNWEEHISKLTDFWETNLFFRVRYKGNPPKVHQQVDENFDNRLTQEHFGHWLQLWVQTVDELFEGEKAMAAKARARKMATFLFMRIFSARKK